MAVVTAYKQQQKIEIQSNQSMRQEMDRTHCVSL